MRNFILFIQRFSNFILFLILEIVCLVMIARTNMLQGNDLLSTANFVAGSISQKRENVAYYFSLRTMNDSLLKENARLQAALALTTQSYDTLKDSMVQRAFLPKDSSHIVQYADYIYRTARVIGNTVNATNNYITLNRGSDDGIGKNMAVISGTGAVGRVLYVSSHFSVALTMLNIKQKVSAQLKDGTIGSVMWQEGNPDMFILEDIPQQVHVNIGDSVFTTSYSFFPQDILIGTIVKKQIVKKNNLQFLYVKPATNFRNIQYVYVVENTKMDERKKLEDSTSNNNNK